MPATSKSSNRPAHNILITSANEPDTQVDSAVDRAFTGVSMISLPFGCRIYLAVESINMHASFDTLALLVDEVIRQSSLNGHAFVFRNRLKDKIKVFWWDRYGFWISYRRI